MSAKFLHSCHMCFKNIITYFNFITELHARAKSARSERGKIAVFVWGKNTILKCLENTK